MSVSLLAPPLLGTSLALSAALSLMAWRDPRFEPRLKATAIALFAAGTLFVVGVLLAWRSGLLPGRPAAAWLVGGQLLLKVAWLWLVLRGPLARLVRPPAPLPPTPLPSLADAQAARQAQAVLQAMETQRLYRRAGLSIGALADAVKLPEHKLRALINGQLDFKNYAAFLNHFRLREVARRLRDPAEAHLPILSIALDEGYASLAPFNRAFREAFGCSPSAYRRPVRPDGA